MAFYKRTLEKINNSPRSKVLISSEFFSQARFENIKKLKNDLAAMGIVLKMIYYVRRQEQFLMSEYMQKVKRGGFEGYPDEYILAHYTQYEHLNYHAYTKRYADLIGKENIHPWIYELTKKHEKGIVGHFLQTVLGRLPDWVEPVKSINTSPTPLEIKFMLACNQYHPRMRFSDILVENSVLRGKSDSYQSHNLVNDAVAEKVIDHFKEQNKRFTEEYTKGIAFPTPKEVPYTSLADITISPEELLNIVSGYLVQYDKRINALEIQAKQMFFFRLLRKIKRMIR